MNSYVEDTGISNVRHRERVSACSIVKGLCFIVNCPRQRHVCSDNYHEPSCICLFHWEPPILLHGPVVVSILYCHDVGNPKVWPLDLTSIKYIAPSGRSGVTYTSVRHNRPDWQMNFSKWFCLYIASGTRNSHFHSLLFCLIRKGFRLTIYRAWWYNLHYNCHFF